MTLDLHISPCPNDTFMFDALINGRIACGDLRFRVEYHDIEALNRNAAAGKADVSKISFAALPGVFGRYALLDSGSALGRGNGPLLVRRAGDTAPIRSVAVPGLHTTAHALLRRLHPGLDDLRPTLFSEIAGAVARSEVDAGVLIHEGRFLFREQGLELIADLGEEWECATGLPLPLGAIVIRRTLPPEVRTRIEMLLRSSIAYAFAHPSDSRAYVKSHAREMDDGVIDRHIALFVNKHSLSLGAEGRRAVALLTGIEPE